MGNFCGIRKIVIANVPATHFDDQQILISQYEGVLKFLFNRPIGNPINVYQQDALVFLMLRAQLLALSGNRFRPLAKETMRYCLLALGHGTCRGRIIIYNLMGILAPVLGEEMYKVFPAIWENMDQDISNPHCAFMESTIIGTLGVFAMHTGSAFREHLQKAFQLTCLSIHNPDKHIRVDSIWSLGIMVVAFHHQDYTAEAQRAYKSLVPTFATILHRDTRKSVVNALRAALIHIYNQNSLSDSDVEALILGAAGT